MGDKVLIKVAIVTGASRGIGKAVALGLAREGFSLALAARSAEALEETKREAREVSSKDQQIECYALDVTNQDSIIGMVADVVSRFGRIDLLLNNAGIFHKGTAELSCEEFCEMLDVNLTGSFRMLHEIVPVMRKQKSGTILNIASRSGKQAKARTGGYAASKFGLVGLNEALYRDLTADGIRVCAICPGWVDTDMASTSGLDPSEMIQTEDIVKTINWLLSLSPSACVPEVFIESIKQVSPIP